MAASWACSKHAARLIAASDVALEQSGQGDDTSETELRSAALARIEAAIGARDMDEALGQSRHLQISEAVDLALSLFPQET
jgi:hypothetical protein